VFFDFNADSQIIFEVWNETLTGSTEILGRGGYQISNLLNSTSKQVNTSINLEFENNSVGLLYLDMRVGQAPLPYSTNPMNQGYGMNVSVMNIP